MDDRYLDYMFRRMHRAVVNPHHRLLPRGRKEAQASWGLRRLLWLGSLMNETANA